MDSHMRLVISFGIACIGYLAAALLALPATAGTNSWTPIGPVAYPFAVDPSSPSTIYAVVSGRPPVFDPSSPNTIFPVVNGNTVTKTTDGGAHWADLTVLTEEVNSLVIDPRSPATIYASLGNPYDYAGVPIYKSMDGGVHWAAEAAEFGHRPTSVVAIAPSLSSTLYAGAWDAVFKSIDGGLSWEMRSNGLPGFYVSALAIDPTNADVVYVAQAVAGFSSGPDTDKIFKSTDGGGQWRQVPIPVPAPVAIRSLAIDPATPSIVYAAYAPFGAGKSGGVLKSIDAGETWIAAQNGLPDTIDVNALAIDPSTPARIYAATQQGVFMSSDAAASWTPINSGLTNLQIWSLSIDRTGSLLRAATAAGLFEYQVAESPPSGTVPVIEYFYAAFDHYFITSNPDEIRKLDSEGPTGWVRTGYQFNAYAAPNVNSAPVCRFFSVTFAPRSSHFYTPFATECATRQADPVWALESSDAFDIAIPAPDGSCAEGLTPVYRLYNNGQGGAPNHRYTTDVTVRAQMIAQGWVPEGLGPNPVEMCSPP